MPDFNIDYVDSSIDRTIDYIAYVDFKNIHITLYINIYYFNLKKEDTKATLVHEFVHIYDFIKLSQNNNDEYFIKNISMYTEYHASQIEELYKYHLINNINNSIDNVNLDFINRSELNGGDKTYAFKFQYFCDNPSLTTFIKMLTAYMYSCGKSNITGYLIKKEPIILPFLFIPCKENAEKIVLILQNIKYNELPSPNEILKISNLYNEMIECYKNIPFVDLLKYL